MSTPAAIYANQPLETQIETLANGLKKSRDAWGQHLIGFNELYSPRDQVFFVKEHSEFNNKGLLTLLVECTLHEVSRTDKNETDILLNILQTLIILVRHKENKFDFDTVGGIPAIGKVLVEFGNHAAIVAKASGVLKNLAIEDPIVDKIFDHEVVPRLIRLMEQHTKDPETQRSICGTIGNLCSNDAHRKSLVVIGALNPICSALRSYPDNADVQAEACSAIAFLGLTADNRASINESGAISLICKAMSNHSNHVDMLTKGCSALANISPLHDSRALIQADDGIRLVIKAMNGNVTNLPLQQKAITMLANMAVEDEFRKKISQDHGLKAIAQAMKSHKDYSLQSLCCRALSNLALNDMCKSSINNEKIIPLIVSAMRSNTTQTNLLKDACSALWNAAANNVTNKNTIIRESAIKCICQAMQKSACGALMILATQSNAIKPMVDNYALKLIIESLKNFPNDPEMISRGCKALRAIFSNSSNQAQAKSQFKNNSGPAELEKLQILHPDNDDTQAALLDLIEFWEEKDR